VRQVLAIVGTPVRFSLLLELARNRGLSVHVASTGVDGERMFADTRAQIVVVGLPLPDITAAALIAALRRRDPRVEVVVVGFDADVGSVAQARAAGAREWIADPVDDRRELVFALGLVAGIHDGQARLHAACRADSERARWDAFVARSPAMVSIVARARVLAERRARCVLLSGELGTGRRALARAIHFNARRVDGPFITIDSAAAIPPGVLDAAAGGSVYFDEIAALSLESQAELLAIIEERNPELQIFAATRRDLASMSQRGELRTDLYHRLNVVAFELPPLRERREDLVPLATALVERLAAAYGIAAPRLDDDVAGVFAAHGWRGNLHEMRNELERILLLVDDDVIRARHFRIAAGSRIAVSTDERLAVTVTGDRCSLDELEREVIRHALLQCAGNVSRAAKYLAITRQTMLYRMKKHGFPSPSQPGV
jgi:two-component system, NtrC family, response regulator AtoC